MSLIKYTPAETSMFFAETLKYTKTPDAPLKRKRFNKNTLCLMKRWDARAVVRDLLPTLNNPKSPTYWNAVFNAEMKLQQK